MNNELQVGTPTFGFDESARESTPQVSKLAVASLILSIVVCCPFTTIAGLVTGLLALRATSKDRALTGRWLAIVAIVVSLLATLGQFVMASQAYNNIFVPIFSGPQSALLAGARGDVSGFQSGFIATAANGNTPETAEAFLAAVKERYGEFESASLDTTTAPQQPPAAGQDLVAEYQLDFAKGRMRATCATEIATQSGAFSMRLRSLVIHDAALGDLRYPPAPTSETP